MLFVDGELTTDQIGEAAAAHGIVLHELTLQRGSLEQAFMQMTGDSVQYHAQDECRPRHRPTLPPASGTEVAAGSEGGQLTCRCIQSSASSSSPPARRGGA